MSYCVYKHTFPNGKVYIGITEKRPKRRWNNGHGYKSGSQPLMYRAIQKYGWENIKHEVLFNGLAKEEAEQKEIELIAYYKSNNPEFGYNIQSGGSYAGKHSDETKRKISESLKGEKHFWYGKHHTEESKKKISEANKARKKCVYQIDKKTGDTIAYFDSIMEAAKAISISHSAIFNVCNKKLKTAGGYIWRYSDDILTQEELEWCNKDERENNYISVSQYSKNGELIKIHKSANNAMLETGVDCSGILKCCKGKYKTAGGYIWMFSEETPTQEHINSCNKRHNQQSIVQYTLSGETVNIFDSIKEAKLKTGISSISGCLRNKQNVAGGYIWRYATDKSPIVIKPNKNKKRIYQIDKRTNNIINCFDSIAEASNSVGVNYNNIHRVCKGKAKTAGGYIWKYVNE